MKAFKHVAAAVPSIILVFAIVGYLYGNVVELMKYSLLTIVLLLFLLPIVNSAMHKVLNIKVNETNN